MSALCWSQRLLYAPNNAQVEELATVLIDRVEGGASVNLGNLSDTQL
jgi:hypothetical protein